MRVFEELALIIALSVSSISAAKSQDSAKSKGGSIVGRVIFANKGIAGVTVTINMSGDAVSGKGLTMKVLTDDDGRFAIHNTARQCRFERESNQ